MWCTLLNLKQSVSVLDKGCSNTTLDSYSCRSLQNELELIAGTHDCVVYTIELETGIIKAVVTDASVYLLSNGESSSVTCDFDAETSTVGLHTVYFNRSQSVSFTNISFDHPSGCLLSLLKTQLSDFFALLHKHNVLLFNSLYVTTTVRTN